MINILVQVLTQLDVFLPKIKKLKLWVFVVRIQCQTPTWGPVITVVKELIHLSRKVISTLISRRGQEHRSNKL